jgi:ABC-type metal ion transport system substrate-binding protein
MKKYFLLAGAVLALASLSAQKKSEKKSKLKPITFEKAIENKLAVQKVVVKKESKKKGISWIITIRNLKTACMLNSTQTADALFASCTWTRLP